MTIRSVVSRAAGLVSQVTGLLSAATVMMGGGVLPVDRWLVRSAVRNAADSVTQIQDGRREALHVLRHLTAR